MESFLLAQEDFIKLDCNYVTQDKNIVKKQSLCNSF